MKKKEPLYRKINNDMAAYISANAGQEVRLPTEAELCSKYNVSRMTVNKAMSMLVQDGLATRIPGRGTFTNPNPIQKRFEESRSFTKDVDTIGGEPGSVLLDYRVDIAANYSDLDKTLKCSSDDRIIFFERLRTSNGKALAVSRTYVLESVVSKIPPDVLDHSFYKFLFDVYGIIPQCTDYMIKARKPTKREAGFLDAASEPLLEVRHISYTQNYALFEYNETSYLGNYFFYVSSQAFYPRLVTRIQTTIS